MSSILIIDDDVTLLARLTGQLEEAGFGVARSSDLAHAERLYAEERPDLVILEVRSGGGAGWELLGRLAAETPVVVLSGAAGEDDVVRGIEAGAVDYIPKPYRSAELMARLRARLATPVAAPMSPMAASAPPVAVAATAGPPSAPASSKSPPARPRSGRKVNGREVDEESVFMSEAEEMALLRLPPADASGAAPLRQAEDEGPQGFGQRLRAERQRRHLTLVQLENELKIRMSYLQALEDEKYTLLPRGPVVLQIVRGYADFLGLDAATITEEFRRQHYIEPAPPPPALGGARLARPMPIWVIWLIAAALAIAIAVGLIYALDPGFFTRLPELLRGLWEQRPG